ncbi:MAG TPA: sigma-54 dependent transcriptional regulator [Bacteroidota bacterium]|nr:sigma-54 dependent transcriptional regulator [Bacteroidota bacterium]
MDRAAFQQQHGIIGQSLEMQEIVDVVQQVAPTDITVLITGESGVGKEVIARALHTASKRAKNQLVSVNCGAIPEGLIESELFGHEKGSFTSAVDARKGYFEIADGGTIFLDEIGETPLATQVKLLRVLENGEYMRVGSSLARTSDVRVIAATNKELQYEVQQKRFRPDLYFRLRSVNIVIPPLRSRREDIPLLIEHFVKETLDRNGIRFEGFTDDATEMIMNYRWPGNIRELKNAIESMLILENGRRLSGEVVRKYLKEYQGPVADRNLPVVANKTVEQAERELIYRALVDLKGSILELRDVIMHGAPTNGDVESAKPAHAGGNGVLSLDEMERKMIVNSLDRHKGNRRLAAKELNISERTLYRKIKEFGLQE